MRRFFWLRIRFRFTLAKKSVEESFLLWWCILCLFCCFVLCSNLPLHGGSRARIRIRDWTNRTLIVDSFLRSAGRARTGSQLFLLSLQFLEHLQCSLSLRLDFVMVHSPDDLSLHPLVGQVLLIIVIVIALIICGCLIVLVLLKHLLDELIRAPLSSSRSQFRLLI